MTDNMHQKDLQLVLRVLEALHINFTLVQPICGRVHQFEPVQSFKACYESWLLLVAFTPFLFLQIENCISALDSCILPGNS